MKEPSYIPREREIDPPVSLPLNFRFRLVRSVQVLQGGILLLSKHFLWLF